MLTVIKGGTIYDPANGIDGEVRDLYIDNDRLVPCPATDQHIDHVIDAHGMIVMAGGIDIHTHIGGGKANIARMMMADYSDPEHLNELDADHSECKHTVPSTLITGKEYAKLGYTLCFEPAVVPSNARQAHLEMADTPLLDTGGYLVLGNDDYFLKLIAEKADAQKLRDYVAWMLNATQCIAVKSVNPGGISAFKFNQRKLNVDEPHSHFGITPGQIVRSLSTAISDIGLSHPLHTHCSNLGIPGNVESTLSTINAADGKPIHLAHVQFHSYGTQGKRKFSSAALEIAQAVNSDPSVSIDVGHVMFGQTVTISADTMTQFRTKDLASPNKSTFMDIECEAGCGVVPFKYRSKNFVNALQWAIGLELFLTIDNPWQVFLTTDHPNGASFTTYPHLIRLLMDRSFRNDMLSTIHRGAVEMSVIKDITREFSLYEIAVLTRAGPARSLGLKDRGHLGAGAVADVVLYRPDENWDTVFRHPVLVIKGGQTVVKDGEIIHMPRGRTLRQSVEFDSGIEKELKPHFEMSRTTRLSNFKISDDEMANAIGSDVDYY